MKMPSIIQRKAHLVPCGPRELTLMEIVKNVITVVEVRSLNLIIRQSINNSNIRKELF